MATPMTRFRVVMLAMAGLPACTATSRNHDQPAPVRFVNEVRAMLQSREPSPEYYRNRMELDEMGPEVEAVLVTVARDETARPVARANALMMLADRRSSAALDELRRTILAEDSDAQRATAVLALQRLAPDFPEAASLIRAAVGDPAPIVRLNAMQALDPTDGATIRAALRVERDADIRRVGLQLLSLAEARGAPLARDRRGALRTAGAETDPVIVFRPITADSLRQIAVGDLRVELPTGPDIPLSPMAEVVANVVPAFFSADRSRIVYEADRQIRVVDLRTRQEQGFGDGLAPRPVPFTHDFVFLRARTRTLLPDGTTELTYEVRRASFGGGSEEIGELQALARPGVHGNYSPVRWMVVGETSEGFVLRGEGISTFELPTTVWSPAGGTGPREQ